MSTYAFLTRTIEANLKKTAMADEIVGLTKRTQQVKRLVSSHWFDQPAWTSPLVLEVMTFFEIRDEPGLHGMPSQPLLGQCARGREVERCEGDEEAKVVA